MTDDISPELIERYKLNSETGRLRWAELARYFASGHLVLADEALDLVDVALQLSRDNARQTKTWVGSGMLTVVSDQQALEFHQTDQEFWAIVVRPWVVVQRASSDTGL